MSTKAKASLEEAIMAGLERSKPKTWEDSIPKTLLDELVGIRAKWRARKFGASKTALARSISGVLKAKKFNVGEGAVARWLTNEN